MLAKKFFFLCRLLLLPESIKKDLHSSLCFERIGLWNIHLGGTGLIIFQLFYDLPLKVDFRTIFLNLDT